jgi:hypothetical protein
VRDTVSLAKTGGESREAHTASFQENHEQPAFPRKVVLGEVKNFTLLVTHVER